MVLDTSCLTLSIYKEGIKGKVEKFRERNRTLPYTSATEKGANFTRGANFTYLLGLWGRKK